MKQKFGKGYKLGTSRIHFQWICRIASIATVIASSATATKRQQISKHQRAQPLAAEFHAVHSFDFALGEIDN